MAYEREIEKMFDLLTAEGVRMRTHAEIAEHVDSDVWPLWKVGAVLATIRDPHVSAEWGFTIPHVPRGAGDHYYQVVSLDQGALGEDEQYHIKLGAISTLRCVATEGYNEAHALRLAAKHVDQAEKRRLIRIATGSEGLAAMAEDAAENLVNSMV